MGSNGGRGQRCWIPLLQILEKRKIEVRGARSPSAISAGECDPRKLAQSRDWRIRASEQTVMTSLAGDYRRDADLQIPRRAAACSTMELLEER